MPRTTTTVTISLDPAMAREVEKLRKVEHRTVSEMWREAMRAYLRVRSRPAYTPTAAERRAMEKGRAAIRRGDYLSLDEFNAYLLDTPSSEAPRRAARPASRAGTTRRRS